MCSSRVACDVMASEYGKALGQGLYELRIRWTAAEIEHKTTGLEVADIGPLGLASP